jgi:hypothetical protein
MFKQELADESRYYYFVLIRDYGSIGKREWE